ncbi:MAG: hypothetical protein LIO91_02970 [Bacteroidales bacterium]|nr:hypothetical protein [Bacteroidales bacterium]
MKKISTLLLTVIALLGITTGCSKDEDTLLRTVPDSASLIAKIDAEQILKNAGFQVKDGKYVMPAQLEKSISQVDKKETEALLAVARTIDAHSIVVFECKNIRYCTFAITDEENFVQYFESQGATKSKSGDFEVLSFGHNDRIAMRDGQGWYSTSRGVDQLPDILKEAKKQPLADMNGVREWLEKDGAFNCAYSLAPLSSNWVVANTVLKDNVLSFSVTSIDKGGKTLESSKMLEPINSAVLGYFPANTQLAVALGIAKGFPWSDIKTAAAPFVGYQALGFLELAMSQMSQIDGTVALAISPAAGAPALADISLKTWDFTLFVHQTQEAVNSNIQSLLDMAQTMGQRVERVGDLYHTTLAGLDPQLNGLDVWIGNVDGYLAISTREIQPGQNNAVAPTMSGKPFSLYLDIPYQSETMKAFGLPYGFNLTLQLSDNILEGKARFNGSNSAFLSTLTEVLSQL